MRRTPKRLPFPDNRDCDIVYAWAVLHHSPDTRQAIREVFRVLRPNGIARVMIYHRKSIAGLLLWLRYGMLTGRTLSETYAQYLESPGTKAYTVEEARRMFAEFSGVSARSQLAFGDLLEGAVGQRHAGMLLTIAKAVWPRRAIKRLFPNNGLLLLVDATK